MKVQKLLFYKKDFIPLCRRKQLNGMLEVVHGYLHFIARSWQKMF